MGAKTAISLIPPMVLEAAQLSSMRGAFALSLSIMENLKSMTYENVLAEKSDTDCIPAPEPGLSDLARKSSVRSLSRSHSRRPGHVDRQRLSFDAYVIDPVFSMGTSRLTRCVLRSQMLSTSGRGDTGRGQQSRMRLRRSLHLFVGAPFVAS
jgi:hypothetical protein